MLEGTNPPQPTSSLMALKKPAEIPPPPSRVQVEEQNEVPVTATKPKVFDEPQPSANEAQPGTGGNDDDQYDELTVDELISLLQNFSKLDKDSQEQLVLYMKKLESTHPDRVAFIKRSLQ